MYRSEPGYHYPERQIYSIKYSAAERSLPQLKRNQVLADCQPGERKPTHTNNYEVTSRAVAEQTPQARVVEARRWTTGSGPEK